MRALGPILLFGGIGLLVFLIAILTGTPSARALLGKELGVSFQQIQKYERGVNRVSAARLYNICKALNVSLSSMFERDPTK